MLGYFTQGYTNDPASCLAAAGYNYRLELTQPAIYNTNGKPGANADTGVAIDPTLSVSVSGSVGNGGKRMLDGGAIQTQNTVTTVTTRTETERQVTPPNPAKVRNYINESENKFSKKTEQLEQEAVHVLENLS